MKYEVEVLFNKDRVEPKEVGNVETRLELAFVAAVAESDKRESKNITVSRKKNTIAIESEDPTFGRVQVDNICHNLFYNKQGLYPEYEHIFVREL